MAVRTVRLFVYGTLQPHAGTRMAEWIAARLVHGVPAVAPGVLHAIDSADGWYPALLPAKGSARVQGTFCEVRMAVGDLALLDRYEGAEYRRIAVPVRTASGRVLAQAYRWRVGMPDKAVRIAGGDFLDWLGANGGKAFSLPRNSCAWGGLSLWAPPS